MARHHDQGSEGRRRQDRGVDDERGAHRPDEQERRGSMDDRRYQYQDEPWASRDRWGWGDAERDWPQADLYGESAARYTERAAWIPPNLTRTRQSAQSADD